jgi:hypothetical protein
VRAVFEKKKFGLCSKILMKINISLLKTIKNIKYGYFYIKNRFVSNYIDEFLGGEFVNWTLFSLKKKKTFSKWSRIKS